MASNQKEVMFEGSKIKVDYESFLSQHDIVFESPPLRQVDCLLLGNGDVGLQVGPSGSQLFFGHVMKSDVWRPTLKSGHLKNYASLEELEKVRNNPEKIEKIIEVESEVRKKFSQAPRPLGNIAVTLASNGRSLEKPGEFINYRQKLSLYNGLVETEYKWKNIGSKVISFVHSQENLIIFHCEDISKDDSNIERSVIIHRKPFPDFKTNPSFSSDNKYFWVKYIFPDGFTYIMMGLVDGIEYKTETGKDEVAAKLKENKKLSFNLYVAISTSNDSPDPLEDAKKRLIIAQNRGYKELLNSHKSWWHNFWSKSFITISDEEVENCWYVGLYLMACSSRGRDMPNEFGPWAMNEEKAPYGGKYWTSEQPQAYWSVFSSNHPELAEPYYRTYYNALPGARENARVLYECKGAIFGHTMDRGGISSSSFPYRFMYESGANVGLIFWWGYLHTQNLQLLKRYSYPVIKELLDFYQDLLKEDKTTGKLYLPAPCCLVDEFVKDRLFEVKNATFPLALIKRLLMAGIEAGQILGIDEQKQKDWKAILSNLPEFPSDGEFFLNYEGEDRHNLLLIPTPLGPVFPAKVIDFNDKRCLNTLQKMFSTKRMTPFGCSLNWPYVSITASWLGKPREAVLALHNILSLCVFPNGWACNHEDLIYLYHRTLGGHEPAVVIPSLFVACVNEMIIQSLYEGTIELFKGVPENWNVRFANLRTVGAFLVSSEKINNEIPYISITSLHGKKCRIKLPLEWQGKVLRVKDVTSSKYILEISSQKIVEFNTESKRSYLIEIKNKPFRGDKIIVKARDVKGTRRYLGLTKKDQIYLK